MPFRDDHACLRIRRLTGVCAALLLAVFAASTLAAETSKDSLVSDQAKAWIAAHPPGLVPACYGDANNLFYPLNPANAGSWTLAFARTDDGSTTAIPLGFTFDMYGDLYGDAFINNNGNISFLTSFRNFTSVGFPTNTFRMVAPFWADVDTRNNPDLDVPGDVYYKSLDSNADGTDDTFVATWQNVGYFSAQHDKRNTFQVAISDGSNPRMGSGNNVCFSYDNMCWTTGGASGGVGGFGGVPATVGVNRGNGLEFFQIGRFNVNDGSYDGPGGNNDGVDYLDGKLFCFNTATTDTNVCPIPTNFPAGGELTLTPFQAFERTLQFLSPEPGQTTTVTLDDPDGAQAAGLALTNTPGNTATVGLSWFPGCSDVGDYSLIFHAADDFPVPCTTDKTLVLHVTCSDGDPCTDDSCDDKGACQHTPADCNDGDPCTDDSCDGKVGCQHSPTDCDDGNPCTDDSCSPSLEDCVHAFNTAPCNDGNACTLADSCAHGVCGALSPFGAISAGRGFTCALRTDGRLACWGLDTFGQVSGPNTSMETCTAVSAGGFQTCAVRTDGHLACWGDDRFGQVSGPNASMNTYSAVSAGFLSVCAVRTGGQIDCWGDDRSGQTSGPGASPDLYTAVSAGNVHTCALRANGGLQCWGDDVEGSVDGPNASAGSYRAISASVGSTHTCALRADGRLACWGDDRNGQTSGPNASDNRYAAVVAGGFLTCALREGGRLVCWGLDNFGQVSGPNASSGLGFSGLGASFNNTCALRLDGTLACFGDDRNGQVSGPNASTLSYGPPQRSCGDENICTDDFCDPGKGCFHDTLVLNEVQLLTASVSARTPTTTPTTIMWHAGPEAGLLYDLARGLVSDLRADGGTSAAVCLASMQPATSAVDELQDPDAGDAYYYMVRARLACGAASTYGYATTGEERLPNTAAACP